MRIAGFKKQSLIDYPGNISSVIFTQGCNFRCGYCHNPELVLPKMFVKSYKDDEIFQYLSKYSKLLNAVCISGGEPTIHKDLPLFIDKIKKIGLKVKLDSNGTNPEMLRSLIDNKMVDFIAMDIKHLLNFELYNKTVGNCISELVFNHILESVQIIKHSKIFYEFRTTIAKGLHTKEHVASLKKQFNENYTLQNFNPGIILDPKINIQSFSNAEFKELTASNLNCSF